MENPSKDIFHIQGVYNSVLRTCCICKNIKPDYVHPGCSHLMHVDCHVRGNLEHCHECKAPSDKAFIIILRNFNKEIYNLKVQNAVQAAQLCTLIK